MADPNKGSGNKRSLLYLASGDTSEAAAQRAASKAGVTAPVWLGRRGYAVAWVAQQADEEMPSRATIQARWDAGRGVVLPGFLASALAGCQEDVVASKALVAKAQQGAEIAGLFDAEPYVSRLAPAFELLASSVDEGDDQEIETLEFDVLKAGELVAEGLWVKASWLSFDDSDASLRFRFSFGMAGYEDVAADFERQDYAAKLTEALFPESAMISASQPLDALLQDVLGVDKVAYVERIIYFNAPNGGAQMHQDVERGHAGVVYAQVSGSTVWLALSKTELMAEIQSFMARPDVDELLVSELPEAPDRTTLKAWCATSERLAQMLDERDNDPLEALINRVPAFVRQLIEKGYGAILKPGDVMLLPQQSMEHCAWHSVYCVGDEAGEALSFAVRGVPL